MYALNKLALIVISVLGFVSAVAAAPVDAPPAAVEPDAAAAHQGWATYYTPGLGACGHTNVGSDHVAAIGTALYQTMMVDGNPNNSKACQKTAHVTYNGKSVQVKIVDRCAACGNDDLDLSPSAFKVLAPLAQGKLQGVTWNFV